MRVGILGGTFDPPHVGHIIAASDAFESLGLDRLIFLPNSKQPLKTGSVEAAPQDRLEMVRLTLSGDERFEVDSREVDRGGLSYLVGTLEVMAEQEPSDTRFFLMGSDSSLTFAQWKNPRRIAELARLAILTRGEGETPDADVMEAIGVATGNQGESPILLRTRRIDVSSTEIRERVRQGRSIHGFVTDAVARFIYERGLYR